MQHRRQGGDKEREERLRFQETSSWAPDWKYLVSSSRRTLAQTTADSDFQLNHVLKEVETGGRPELEGGR